jgi:7-cyano-7-deazaguanine synthase
MRNSKKAVVLLSGGVDSATALYIAKNKGFLPLALVFDYGQRHKKEISAAKKIAASCGCACRVLKISLPWKGSSLLGPRTGARMIRRGTPGQIPATYVPARNIIFLSFALSYAEAVGAEAIFIGANAVDYSGYPDCRPEFYRAFAKVVASGTKVGARKNKISVYTPLIAMTKAEIIRSGMRLGVPYKSSWSCYQGGKAPCGKCDSCYYRQKGFRQAGVVDPLSEKR